MQLRFFGAICNLLLLSFLLHFSASTDAKSDPLSKSTFKYFMNEYVFEKATSKFKVINSELIPKSSLSTCTLCNYGAEIFIQLRRLGLKKNVYTTIAIFICKVAGVDKDVCEGAVNLHVDLILYIIDNTPTLSGRRFCAVYLQSSGCEQPEGYDWTIDIPEANPFEIDNKKRYEVRRQHKKPLSSGRPLKIVHMSDIHYEAEYVVGSLADCSKPVCCVKSSGFPEEGKNATVAGAFGMYGDCDTPWVTVISTFENIKENHPDVDFIYYTGDTIHHRVWETSLEGNRNDLTTILLKLNASFPNVPVIPVIGNHESNPTNSFAPGNINAVDLTTSWLYKTFAEDLPSWISPEARETAKKAGYFTEKLMDDLRIIGLNSNLCVIENWWLMYDKWYVDPADQLKWLVQVLLEAERNGENVHIISHVPSANGDCLAVWSREYRRVIQRFHKIITGQFVGHSHRDDYTLYFDMKDTSKPINVAYNGGSVQPGANPNYIVYRADPENYEVIGKESWIFNLTQANDNPNSNPIWFKLYDFKEEFDLKDLSPDSLYDLALRLAKNESLRIKYVSYRYKGVNVSCDDSCYRSVLCRIVKSETADNEACDNISNIYE